jgi:predicted CXXCH cytochrome family protein
MHLSYIKNYASFYVVSIGALLIAFVATSCSTNDRILLAPPQIAGSTFVGTDKCSDCHEDNSDSFENATHSWIQGHGENAVEVGCESCHGAGSQHVESGGAYETIINPGQSPDTCFQCHTDKHAEFRLPNRHPVLEGYVSCINCHNPHDGSMIPEGDLGLLTQNDTCLDCHSAQRGPFVFEHEAIREGCTTCHSPHGSVNAKMLKTRNANLCLQCHAQDQTDDGILIGDNNHARRLPTATCWSAGCHEAIHGSNVSERLRY